MYDYEWDIDTGGYLLTAKNSEVVKQLRPVFFEELELLELNKHWSYPKTYKPLLWAEAKRYIYNGRTVAKLTGGGLYKAPDIKIYEKNLEIHPVNVSSMIAKNQHLFTSVVRSTIESIYRIFSEYRKKKIDVFYVAFSGGKDSLVLLDLVQRVLPDDEFKVIFSDTTMEISDTYKAVEMAKQKWDKLEFHTAKSHINAKESWQLFGPPSRVQRWCCGVHKSAPAILLLRELTGKVDLKVLAFDGIRAEESNSRSSYSLVSDGSKHLTQINCSPLIDWNTSELYLYILENNLLLNNAYRYGAVRVGCSVCPMASPWWEHIANNVYHDDTYPFIDIIEKSVTQKFSASSERKIYINTGGWKGRMAGRDLDVGGNKVIEQYDGKVLTLYISGKYTDWREWIKTIGYIVSEKTDECLIKHKSSVYQIKVEQIKEVLKVSIDNHTSTKESIHFIHLLKKVCNKTAYCVRCKVCMVECRYGALKINDNEINVQNNCKHCESCFNTEKGCLAAKSLYATMGGKGINKYQRFGFRKEWLSCFFQIKDKIWSSDKLNRHQLDSFQVWMNDAGITHKNSLTPLGVELSRLGVNDIRTWAVIVNNLAYNSPIFKWYIQNIPFGETYEIKRIVDMIGEDLSKSARENAVTSLKETFKTSPIGKELGVGNYKLKGKSIISVDRSAWKEVDQLVILYSLYKFAEASDKYYSFTFAELVNDNVERVGMSPVQIFGIGKEDLKHKIQGVAIDYPNFISVAFNKDLDNIDLRKEKTSLDVFKHAVDFMFKHSDIVAATKKKEEQIVTKKPWTTVWG